MIGIDNYKMLFLHKKINVIFIWLFVTIFIIIMVVLVLNNVYYEEYYQNKGVGTKEGYIKCFIEVEDTKKLINNSRLIIDNNKYNYKIVGFKPEISNIGTNYYQEILISIDNKILPNRYISFKVPVKKYSFLNYIKNKIRGSI